MSQGAAQQPATQPVAPTAQPAAPAALTPQQEQLQRFNRAYYAYLANPDMPLDPSESTGTLRGDQQALARARAARMLAAGQSAVAERAAAQGRLQGTDPVTGAPIVGAATAAPIVQESPGGVRVAYRNGIPVGFSTPQPTAMRSVTPTAALPNEMAAVQQEATRLAADQSAARMRAAEDLRNAIASAPAIAAAQAAPVAAAPAMVRPVGTATPSLLQPLADDTPAAASRAARAAGPLGRTVPNAPVAPDMTPEEQLAEAEAQSQEVYAQTAKMLEEAPRKAAEQKVATKEQQIRDLQLQLADAQRRRSSADIGRLTRMLRAMLQSRTTVDQELRKIEEASREPMFIGP